MAESPAPRRARHLIDPSQPRPQTSPEDLARLQRVQRWVLSVLVATTIGHLAIGLLLSAFYVTPDNQGAQVGLCILAAVTGLFAVVAGFTLHQRSPLNAWVLLGALPGLVALWFVLT